MFWVMLILQPSTASAQIDLFGKIATTLDRNYKHLSPPFDSTRVYDIGWNVTPAPVRFQYAPLGNPPDVPVAVPDTSQSFTNNTPNAGTFPYEAVCKQTVKHTWQITDGMIGNLVGNFNSLPGIDSASPGSGGMHLTQGETASKEVPYSQPVRATVPVPAMSTVTYQTFFHERQLDIAFDVDVKIGGSFRFEALRGDCGQGGTGRCTRASFTEGLGKFYREVPDPHIQVLDDQFVVVKLHGRYSGAIGTTPGNFTCEVKALP
jgi:hypothetical protein